MHALHSHIDKCTSYLICSDYLQKTRANMESNHQMGATKWTFSIASVGSVRAYHVHAHLSARTHAHTHTHHAITATLYLGHISDISHTYGIW